MFADDTTVYCISDTAEKSIAKLNSALRELNEWCLINRLTPHPSKSEAMLISRRNPPVNLRFPRSLSEILRLNGYRNDGYWE